MMDKHRWSLRNNLGGQVMSLLSVALLSTLIVFSISVFYFVNRTEKEAWQGRQSEAARNAAGTISSFIRGVEESLLILGSAEPDQHSMDSAGLQAWLDRNPSVLEVIRTDDAGTLLAADHRDHRVLANMTTITRSDWFLNARAGQSHIGNLQRSARNEPYLVMAVPSPDGGVVAARVQMNVLWDVVRNIHFGETGRAYVLTRQGQIVAHTNAEILLGNTSIQARPEFIRLMVAPKNEWFGTFQSLDGKTVVGRASPIEGTDWLIMMELPWTEAYRSTRRAVSVLGTEAVILLLFTSWWMGRRVRTQITEPMELLRKGADAIGEGHLNYRLDMNRQDEIGKLASALNAMAKNLQQRDAQVDAQTTALLMSEERYRAIVEDQTELICRFLPDGTLTFVNEAYCRYFGKPREELIGCSFIPKIPEEDKPLFEGALNALDKSNQVVTREHRVILPDGSLRWQHWTDRLVFFESGKILEYASVGRDITERMKAEEELRRLNLELEDRVRERTEALSAANQKLQNEVIERKAAERQVLSSLQEKEVLLKEIHHRVKNNLQIISSLLSLQNRGMEDHGTLQALRDSQMRVRSMALIHEKLYQSPSLANIDFGEYVKSLIIDLFRTYRGNASAIQLDIKVEQVFLGLDHAVSCGLILNELMTNALKYAFPNGRSGTIQVELRSTPEEMLHLLVSDDGVGLPSGFDVFHTQSLGLQLVQNLVKQLDATLAVETSDRTSFLISFQYGTKAAERTQVEVDGNPLEFR